MRCGREDVLKNVLSIGRYSSGDGRAYRHEYPHVERVAKKGSQEQSQQQSC